MIQLEMVNRSSAAAFKDIRLRALQASPTAFSVTYAEASKLTDGDWAPAPGKGAAPIR